MISAEEFIDILEQKDLLEPDLVSDLRRRVEQSMAPVSAALLAKRLVDKGHLSRKLAQRLLDRADSEPTEEPAVVEEPAQEEVVETGSLGLAPLEEEDADEELVEEEVSLEMSEDEDWGLQELEEDRPSVPPAPAPAAPVQPATPIQPAVPVQPATPVPPAVPLVDGLEEIEEIGESLDALGSAAMAGEPLDGALGGSRPGKRGKKIKGGKGAKGNVWDSSLMLIGGGTLLFLTIMLIVLYFVLSGRGADDMLAQANDYYAGGSYTKAEDSYSKFLEKFPKHPGAGSAKVKLGLAKMRQVMGSDWPTALEVAQTEIQLISGEETFATDARPELASMLPDIADGLAKKAHSSHDDQMADLAEDGIALVEKYVPSSSRPEDRLQDIRALIALTRREIARTERLTVTVDEMVKAAEEGRTQDGYELRRALLKEYPILLTDPSLIDAVRIISKAEQAAVEKVEKTVSAVTDEPESKAIATIGLAQRAVRTPVSGVGDQRVFAVAGGAAYGLDATEGKVLWRRDIGFEENVRGPQFPPTPISERPGADPLLVSRSRQEVLRVEGSTGKIRWRFPVGEPFDAHPVVFDGRVLVATRSGRLLSLDLETGNSSDYLQFPQSLRVGPAADNTRNAIYQIGEHSSLFVLSATDGTCTSVIYLGHEPGSIIVPPVRVSRYLLVCENDGIHDSVVNVLDLDPQAAEGEEEAPPVRVVQQARLKGHVYTTPIVSGPQVLLVTDAGMITVFQLTGAEGKEPLSLSAEGATAGEDRSELVRYASIAAGRIWIADSQLTQYAVRSAERRLKPSWIANEGSVSLQPPIVAGKSVIQVRSRRGMPGVVVSAVGVEKGATLWETTLASPTAGTPVPDKTTGTVIATTSVGGVFQVKPPADNQVSLRDDPTKAISSAQLDAPIGQVVRLPSGLFALVPNGAPIDIHVFQPATTPGQARIEPIALPDPLSGAPISFADGLLVPTRTGQVFLLDPRTGDKIAEPFQPQLQAGRKYRWSRPALFEDDQFVIADDSGGLHLAIVKTEPKHLAEKASVRLDDPVTSPLAVLGNRVYAVDRADSLVWVDLPGLTDKTQQPLGAKCVLGPVTIGDYVLLITNDDLMHVVNSSGEVRVDSLPYGRPTGEPVVDGTHWLFATQAGVVWRVDPATGEELAKQETGLALGSSLALYGSSRLIVAGHDGTLYLINKP